MKAVKIAQTFFGVTSNLFATESKVAFFNRATPREVPTPARLDFVWSIAVT
jgi:hypothetical protein